MAWTAHDPAPAKAGLTAPPAWSRLDMGLAVLLGLVALATRWMARGRSLLSYDSGLLASGILAFDFDHESPHPPYYPLAIAAGKGLATVMPPADALVLLAVLASGVLVAATYAVARQIGGRAMALAATAVVLFSPTALFNGAVALTYALEGAASAVVALAAWRVHAAPSPRRGVVAGVLVAVAVGIRPSAALFLVPVLIWAVWHNRNALAGAAAGGVATGLAWGVPMLVAGGGLRDFLTYNGYQSRHVILSRTVADGGPGVASEHLMRLASYLPHEVPYFAAVVAAALVAAVAAWPWVPRGAPPFLAAWGLPGFLFYALIYVGWPVHPSGYVMVLLPAFAVACGVLLSSVARGVLHGGAPVAARGVALALIVAIAATPVTWAASWDEAMAPQRAADRFDADWRFVERAFPSNETAFLTFIQWHWARVEHPDYLVWGVRPYWNETGILLVQVSEARHGAVDRPTAADALDGPFEDPHPVPSWVRRVVLLDEGTGPDLVKPETVLMQETLPSGRRVWTFDPSGLDSIEQALPWFDRAGRLDPTTLSAEDQRGR